MAIATGHRSQLAYIPEVTWGTTPGTPQMISVPYTSFKADLTKQTFEDNSIIADRMARYVMFGNQTVAGELEVNLSHGNFDFLLESACNGAFTANVLKTGSTKKFFTFESGALDISQYTVYTGMLVDKMTITIPSNAPVTAKFDLMGKSSSISGTALDATLTAAGAKQPYVHVGGTFNEGGSATAIITTMAFTVDNGYDANFALGSTSPRDVTYDLAKITGTVTAYFEDAVLYNKFINGTSTSLSATLTDGTNTLQFSLPKIYYTGGSKPVSSQKAILVTLPFVAVYDGTSTSNIVITRST